MKTKLSILTALVALAGSVAVNAQTVYSLNIAGYVNLTIPNGYSMIANPLDSGTNTVGNLFGNTGRSDGLTIYKFLPNGSYDINALSFGSWGNTAMTLNPGEGAFILNESTALNVTFVGDIKTGSYTNPVPSGFSIRSSIIPKTGTLDALGVPGQDGDQLYRYNTTTLGYDTYTVNFGSWAGPDPTLKVGESFFILLGAPANWVRSFDVSAP
jgi:hypothetical protein